MVLSLGRRGLPGCFLTGVLRAQPGVGLAGVAGRVAPRWQLVTGCVEQAGGPDGGGVVDASGQGVSRPGQGPGQRAGDLDTPAGPAVLAGSTGPRWWSSLRSRQARTVPSMTRVVAGSRSSTVGTLASRAWAIQGRVGVR